MTQSTDWSVRYADYERYCTEADKLPVGDARDQAFAAVQREHVSLMADDDAPKASIPDEFTRAIREVETLVYAGLVLGRIDSVDVKRWELWIADAREGNHTEPPDTSDGRLRKRSDVVVRMLRKPIATGSNTHSADFRSVFWDGKHYSFSPAQAKLIEALWNAYENGTPELSTEALGIACGSEAAIFRPRDAFNKGKHPAWETMVVKGATKGTLKLFSKSQQNPT